MQKPRAAIHKTGQSDETLAQPTASYNHSWGELDRKGTVHDNTDSKLQFCSPQPLLVAAVLATSVLAGCGGGSSNSRTTTSASTGRGSASAESTLAFSRCMRSHGVPDFPDLPGDGIRIAANGQNVSVNGVHVSAPAFAAARQTCQTYVPRPATTRAQAAHQRQSGLEFAQCMRNHGVPNFPDPKAISSSRGNSVVELTGVNLSAPAVQAASKACGGFAPKGP